MLWHYTAQPIGTHQSLYLSTIYIQILKNLIKFIVSLWTKIQAGIRAKHINIVLFVL